MLRLTVVDRNCATWCYTLRRQLGVGRDNAATTGLTQALGHAGAHETRTRLGYVRIRFRYRRIAQLTQAHALFGIELKRRSGCALENAEVSRAETITRLVNNAHLLCATLGPWRNQGRDHGASIGRLSSLAGCSDLLLSRAIALGDV